LGILCGGGPAPGINSVIGAATICAALAGAQVIGIRDGFKWLMRGDTERIVPLTIEQVSRIHFNGGSYLGTARANPTRSESDLENTLRSLEQIGITHLITIGGDDTAYSAMIVAEHSRGQLQVVHVPKTIDNDLDLPEGIATFGYQTARHLGVDIVKNLMVDARTTSRWYVVVTMGRKAGHLALGIAKAAGATLCIIPEEFGSQTVTLDCVVDILAGAIIKRRMDGREDGTAVLAEGLVEHLSEAELASFGQIEHDEHGHVRLAEINLGEVVKDRLRQRLNALGISTTTVVAKDIGYELRCADPIPLDMEYTRDLGYCAASYLLGGGRNAMVALVDGHFKSLPFRDMLDPSTGRTRVRLVDVASEHYKIARRYMVRLRREDFDDPAVVARLATAAKLSPEEFRKQFEYVVETETPPLQLGVR